MDLTWPQGWGTPLHVHGRARDLLTPVDGAPVVLAQASFDAKVAADRTVTALTVDPPHEGAGGLVGAQGGGGFRRRLAEVLPEQVERGTPLHLLLDDVPGGTLIAGFAWSRWPEEGAALARSRAAASRKMIGICSGFRPGSSALTADGTPQHARHNVVPVPPLADAGDPWSWHDLPDLPAVALRRARRIDVWQDGPDLVVDAMFRDSTLEPDGTPVGVHEYQLDAVADAATGALRSLTAEPRVLPFPECPGAAPNAARLIGLPLTTLRREVLERLRSVDGCTHLNDALRSLAEAPVLARALVDAEP